MLRLTSTTSVAIINQLKVTFSIPEVLRTDNGPQYSSEEFALFTKEYDFRHQTSSPHYPRCNGFTERMVQTAKQLLRKSGDVHLAYRATPLPWCNLSPTQLLMGRCVRTTLPHTNAYLIPHCDYLDEFRKADERFKQKQQRE